MCQNTWCHIRQDSKLHNRRSEKLKSYEAEIQLNGKARRLRQLYEMISELNQRLKI